MTERTLAAELETKRRILDALDHQTGGRIPTGPPYISPLERRVALLEERQKQTDAMISLLLELPVVRHSGVVTATLESE